MSGRGRLGIAGGVALLGIVALAWTAVALDAQGRRNRAALEQTTAARIRAEVRVATLLRIAQTDQATIAALQARIAVLETPVPPRPPRPDRGGPVPVFGRW